MKGDAATRAALRAMTAMDDAMNLPDEPIRAKPSGTITEDLRARLEQAYERAAIHIYSETLMVLSETDLAAILAASSSEPVEDEALVRRIARALCEHDGHEPDQLEPGDDPYHNNKPCIDGYNRKDYACHYFWRRYDGPARAALAATRRLDSDGGDAHLTAKVTS